MLPATVRFPAMLTFVRRSHLHSSDGGRALPVTLGRPIHAGISNDDRSISIERVKKLDACKAADAEAETAIASPA